MLRKLLLLAILPLLALTREASSQDNGARPPELGVEARLKAKSRVARAGQKLPLVLTVTAKTACKIEGTVLAGIDLECTVDGKPAQTFRDGVIPDKVALAAGAQIERTFEIDLARVAPNVEIKDGKLLPVSFTWPGLPGAVATIDVAPDSSKIELDALDLEKTKVMLVTNFGTMTVKFFPTKAPNHARNFVKLAQAGFYDGTKFHRVLKGFMIQGGCPNTKEGASGQPGTGDPGYRIAAEFNDVKHVRGILSMARSMDPNSAGCQFFVMHGEAPPLDGKYTAFGQLESGLDTLDKIVEVPVGGSPSGEISAPTEPVHLFAAIVLPVLKQSK